MEPTVGDYMRGGIMNGYAGNIAWVDLTSGSTRTEELSEEIARKYLGGKGLGAYLFYNHLKPHTDAYDPSNLLIFVAGPLTGTTFPCVARGGVITKSPMTGTFLDSYAGGIFGPSLKYAGYDALVITGKSKKPSYISLNAGNISIQDASSLWGLSTFETEKHIRDDIKPEKKERMGVAIIGPAGEKLVRFSGILTENRIFGRGGAGAVMGSKNLKAVVVKGTKEIGVFDRAAFKEVMEGCQEKIGVHPLTKRGGVFPRVGTIMTVDLTEETGTLPTRNWRENTFDHANNINGESFTRHILKHRSCYLCPIGCSRDSKGIVGGREYVTEGPEYETIYAFGSNLEIGDPNVIIAVDRLCDEYGMDTISCGGAIGFTMECVEKGLISKKDIGFDLSFGNGEAVLSMVHLIGKREGIGDLLAEGVMRASSKIEGSSSFAMHVKGLELPGYDPRGMKGQGLTYALSDRGACHLRSNTIRTELLGLPTPIDRYAYKGKAVMVAELQLTYVMFDCLIGCVFGGLAITPDDYVNAIRAITGWSFSLEELRTISQRVWALTRLFNSREGFTRNDDSLPKRLFTEASTKGPSKGHVVDKETFERMLDEYYEIVGWDKKTGIPTDSRLKELGIER
jgi:aldehyde:ferredoxin oxidoreductase